MSYRISYGKEPKRGKGGYGAFGLMGVCIVLLVWLLAAGWFLPQQTERFRELFLPWTSEEVSRALAEMREDVRSGTPFREAAQAFCSDLIYGTSNAN